MHTVLKKYEIAKFTIFLFKFCSTADDSFVDVFCIVFHE